MTELDIEDFSALWDYLRANGHIDLIDAISFQKLAGGISNKIVRVTWSNGCAWVLKQALAKLRVNIDWFSSPERIRAEARALCWLNRLAPLGTTPLFIFEDPANHLMAMEAIPEEHENWKSVLLSGQIIPEHFEQFGVLLGIIHRRSSDIGPDLCRIFENREYFESLRLDPYYIYTAQKVSAAASFLHSLVQETVFNRLSLVHGDFSPKNTLIYRGRLVVLDFEVVHFGDPAFDVGFALTHFLSKAHHLRQERTRLAKAAALFWLAYCKEISPLAWAAALETRAVRHTLGCLLARVAGKSPLEYLTQQAALRQKDVVLSLIAAPPSCVNDLIDGFIRRIDDYAEN
jgi:5-methylthioribose kinase